MAQDVELLAVDPRLMEAHVARMVVLKIAALRSLAREMGLGLPALTESDRIAELRGRATPPASCGPEMPAAPARGAMRTFAPSAVVRTAEGFEVQHVGFAGRNAARACDVFDVMADQARRRGGTAPFSAAQIATARSYAAMVERHSARGLRGISVELRSGVGGGGGRSLDYMDVVVAEGDRIRAMHRAIGPEMALEMVRAGSGKRSAISTRQLVDGVCLEGLSLSDLLRRYGWAVKGETRAAAQAVLCRALDRMAG